MAAGRGQERWWRTDLVVVGLTITLQMLTFFILRRDSASTVWQSASAKVTAMTGARTEAAGDSLLGGLLARGADDRLPCRSRYEAYRYYRHFPYAPSAHLRRKLRAYESRHRRCAPGTPLYADAVARLRSGGGVRNGTDAAATEPPCRYVVWLPFDGLGNRMLSMLSGFLYALLTGRVLLVAVPPDSADLFCEPFPGTTWRIPPEDLPVANLFGLGPHARPDQSYTNLLRRKKIIDAHATWFSRPPPPPPYVFLSLGWDRQAMDKRFFCGEDQRVLAKVPWLLLHSDLYFVPSLYSVPAFRAELRRMFPAAMESVCHLLARYLFHPTDTVWGMVTMFHRAYLAPARRRVGVQIRMFSYATVPVDDMYNQILACSRLERILPELTNHGGDELAPDGAGSGNNGSTTAILIASLHADYYERLRAAYYERAAKGGAAVGVFQPTHEGRQATGELAHNQRALAEIFLLAFSDELLTSGLSTFGYVSSSLAGVRPTILLTAFGHKVPEPPCRRAVSMEPCNLTPPRVECWHEQAADEEADLARHVKVCEDFQKGVKLFD